MSYTKDRMSHFRFMNDYGYSYGYGKGGGRDSGFGYGPDVRIFLFIYIFTRFHLLFKNSTRKRRKNAFSSWLYYTLHSFRSFLLAAENKGSAEETSKARREEEVEVSFASEREERIGKRRGWKREFI